MSYDYFENETRKHQQEVSCIMIDIAKRILDRATTHDASKLKDPEREIFAKHTKNLKNLTYGSDEYKKELELMKPALDHHYSSNHHHPEFNLINCFSNPGLEVDGVHLIDIVEMFCDWVAATKRHADGNIGYSININQKRFSMTNQLTQILRNTAESLGVLYAKGAER